MSLSIVVNGGGTFSASMEEGPVSFTATLGAVPGPKGDTGDTGPAGVVSATAPVTYDGDTQTVGIDTTYFVRSPEVAPEDGQILAWDAGLARPDWIDNNARTLFVVARNDTGSTIPKGSVVYISGATGNRPSIALAQAIDGGNPDGVIGITAAAISNNSDGNVIVSGLASNLDTSAFSAGDELWLSPTTAGGLTTTRPVQPYHSVAIGVVTRSNPSQGTIEVKIQVGEHLEWLHDVLLTTPSEKDLLAYDSATGLWKNKSFTTLGLALATNFDSYYTQAEAEALFQSIAGMSSYLTTSAAATTYAPIVHTHTASAITDFSTAVPAAVPAASTTVAGKVELATDAEAVDGTSTSLAITPHSELWGRINPSYYRFTSTDSGSQTSGGFSATTSMGLAVRCGTTTGTYGARVFEGTTSGGAFVTVGGSTSINFGRRIFFSGRCQVASASESANIVQRITYGKRAFSFSGSDIGDLTVRGFGIKLQGGDVAAKLMVHDGTTLTNVTSSFTPTAGATFDWVIESDGTGNVTLYVNGSSVATTSAGPSTTSTGTIPTVWVECEAINTVSSTALTALQASNLTIDLGTV